MTQVKICGLQTVEAVLVAAQAGAEYLGFVFVPGVRRQLTEEQAKEIIGRFRATWGNLERPRLVGLFSDQPLEEVNNILQGCGLDMAQLCGKETAAFCRQVARPVIKVIHVPTDGGDLSDVAWELGGKMEDYMRAGCICTLDRGRQGQPGGTGERFDWAIARELAREHPIILAGGLTPENVTQAIYEVEPWGVDVSSGVETDGVKDLNKIMEFIRAAKGASALTTWQW